MDLLDETLMPHAQGTSRVAAVMGKAGSGKTVLLARIAQDLEAAGVEVVSGDFEGRRRRDRRTLAILAPTNKAASVLRRRGVPATTIHRILYTPVYDQSMSGSLNGWLDKEKNPRLKGSRKRRLIGRSCSLMPIALSQGACSRRASGSDFITGWKRRDEPLDIGLIDEASMLDSRQYEDLCEIFPTLVLFGDPAQLAPVNQSGAMVFDALPEKRKLILNRVHRQAEDNPILDLAHALADPDIGFEDFERLVEQRAAADDRVQVAARVEAGLMARSPVLVWRNATRVRLIHAFRAAYNAPADALLPGEPLICDGIELPLKHRKKRLDLEARGLIKGAQVIYLGPGKKPGFSRLHVLGAEDPRVSAASIVKIEMPDSEEPFIPHAARMGAAFLHGAAVTIHKAQGSQWPSVQVFAPDLYAAARMGRMEAGIPLWKRLAYVAITRAEERLLWVTRYRLARPASALGVEDLPKGAPTLELKEAESSNGA